MYKFELGQTVYLVETRGYYFYVKPGKVKSYSIYRDKTLYKVEGINLNGEYNEHELLTEEEVSKKLNKWLGLKGD